MKKKRRIVSYDIGRIPLYPRAKRTIIESQRVSASYLQRQLLTGYHTAVELLTRMEQDKIIGRTLLTGKKIALLTQNGQQKKWWKILW